MLLIEVKMVSGAGLSFQGVNCGIKKMIIFFSQSPFCVNLQIFTNTNRFAIFAVSGKIIQSKL